MKFFEIPDSLIEQFSSGPRIFQQIGVNLILEIEDQLVSFWCELFISFHFKTSAHANYSKFKFLKCH